MVLEVDVGVDVDGFIVVSSSSASALDGLVVSMVAAWDKISDFVAMDRKLDRSICSSVLAFCHVNELYYKRLGRYFLMNY